MILCLDTSQPESTLALYSGQDAVAEHAWAAHRTLATGLLKTIDDFLAQNNTAWKDVHGIVVFRGPGSFTGLRIGLTVMNAFAYSYDIPIVGSMGDAWIHDGISRLTNQENDYSVMPEYGAPARITSPKK